MRSIATSGAPEVLADLAEVGLDRLFDDGVLKDVPVIGSLLRLRSTIGLVRDHLFARKVGRFLLALQQVALQERDAFISGLTSPKERKELGDTLLLLLDRLDDLGKPQILARFFAHYVRGRCDLPTFRRPATVLDRVRLDLLPALRTFYSSDHAGFTLGGDGLAELTSAGLIGVRFFPSDAMVGGAYAEAEFGKLFLQLVDAA